MPRKEYESVSIPRQLTDTVRDALKDHPELGIPTLAEFVRTAVREKLQSLGVKPTAPAKKKPKKEPKGEA